MLNLRKICIHGSFWPKKCIITGKPVDELNMMKKPGRRLRTAAKDEFNCTELELHAFVDGELDMLERRQVIKAAQQSANIRTEINALEKLRSLLMHSYADIRYPH